MSDEKELEYMDLSTYWEYKTCPLFTRGREGEGNSCGCCAHCQIKNDYGSVGGYKGLKSAVCKNGENRGKKFFEVLSDCD